MLYCGASQAGLQGKAARGCAKSSGLVAGGIALIVSRFTGVVLLQVFAKCSAIILDTPAVDKLEHPLRSSAWFSSVRNGAMTPRVVRFTFSDSNKVRTLGNLVTHLAAVILLCAALSEYFRFSVQKLKSEECPRSL